MLYKNCQRGLRVLAQVRQQRWQHSQSDSVTSDLFRVSKNKGHFKIEDAAGTQLCTTPTFSWLRDHCRSNEMYIARTFQRSKDIIEYSVKVHPTQHEVNNDTLIVHWDDGHTSEYSLQWLLDNGPVDSANIPHADAIRSDIEVVDYVTWGANNVPDESETAVPFKELSHVEGVSRAVRSLLKNGFCFITQSPANTLQGTKGAVEMITKVMKSGPDYGTHGAYWEFTSEQADNLSDSSFSNIPLGAHTDCTYLSFSPGVQVFHCLLQSEQGGENVLVDGFNVALKLKERCPEAFKFFTEVPLEAEYVHQESQPYEHYYNVDKLIKLDPLDKKKLFQFRYNIYDRAPHRHMTLEQQEALYEYLPMLAKEITDAENVYWTKLSPGKILFVNNWRVMHGRSGFSGKRIISGCYISRDDFMSRVRSLGFAL